MYMSPKIMSLAHFVIFFFYQILYIIYKQRQLKSSSKCNSFHLKEYSPLKGNTSTKRNDFHEKKECTVVLLTRSFFHRDFDASQTVI